MADVTVSCLRLGLLKALIKSLRSVINSNKIDALMKLTKKYLL